MNSVVDQKQQNQAVSASPSAVTASWGELDFNFELWAKAVKQQMIASLRKRGESS